MLKWYADAKPNRASTAMAGTWVLCHSGMRAGYGIVSVHLNLSCKMETIVYLSLENAAGFC